MSDIKWFVKNGKAVGDDGNEADAFKGDLRVYHPNKAVTFNTKEVGRNCLQFYNIKGAESKFKKILESLLFEKISNYGEPECFVAIPNPKLTKPIELDDYVYTLKRAELHFLKRVQDDAGREVSEFIDYLDWEQTEPTADKKDKEYAVLSRGRTSWRWRG